MVPAGGISELETGLATFAYAGAFEKFCRCGEYDSVGRDDRFAYMELFGSSNDMSEDAEPKLDAFNREDALEAVEMLAISSEPAGLYC